MKTTFKLFALLFLISCAEEQVQRIQAAPEEPEVFESFLGTWTFEGEQVSGEFTLIKEEDEVYIDTSGHITLDGHEYNINIYNQVGSMDGDRLTGVTILHDIDGTGTSTYNICLLNAVVNEDFTEITFSGYFYQSESRYYEAIETEITCYR